MNQLRELNDVEGNLKVDEAYLAYATARANEMQDSGILTHTTKLTEPGPAGEHGSENASVRGARGRDGEYILFDHIETHETLAYKHLLGCPSDVSVVNSEPVLLFVSYATKYESGFIVDNVETATPIFPPIGVNKPSLCP